MGNNTFTEYENFNNKHNNKNIGYIMFHHFQSWDLNSDWELQLNKDEEALCLAIGSCYVATATNKKMLRIFTLNGISLLVRILPGFPVGLTGQGSMLASFYHTSNPDLDGTQRLSLELFD